MRAPEVLQTTRLLLRRPRADDAEAIFTRWASDPDVTRYLAWRRHRDIGETRAFLAFSDSEWERWPAGPLLVEDRGGVLIGSVGFAFERPDASQTGYVLARDAWGHGYASEALGAVVALAPALGVRELTATVHHAHAASKRVLEKHGFEHIDRMAFVFPNLGASSQDAWIYRRAVSGIT